MINDRRSLEKELTYLRKSHSNLINANTELVDRNKWLERENEIIYSVIKELKEYIGSKEHYDDSFDTEVEKINKMIEKVNICL